MRFALAKQVTARQLFHEAALCLGVGGPLQFDHDRCKLAASLARCSYTKIHPLTVGGLRFSHDLNVNSFGNSCQALEEPSSLECLKGVLLQVPARLGIEALPLAANGHLAFEYIPVGPLLPLGLLIESLSHNRRPSDQNPSP
jgi:hypothetical protein